MKENKEPELKTNKSRFVAKAVTDYISSKGVRENADLAKVREKTSNHPCAKMQITPEQGQLLIFLTKLTGVKNALEIGVFTGYSAMAVAQALPENGKLIAIDKSFDWTSRAVRFWKDAGIADKIDLRLGDGCEQLQRLVEEEKHSFFDMIFIDADKKNYINYYNFAKKLVRKGGLVIIDNTLWRGSVTVMEPDDLAARQMQEFNDMVYNDPEVEICMLPVGDGMTLLFRI